MLLIASSTALNIRKSRSGNFLKQEGVVAPIQIEPVQNEQEIDAPLQVSNEDALDAGRQAYDKVDIDHKGDLDENQVEAAIEHFCDITGLVLPNEDVLQKAFIKFDADHSGKLDFNEFFELLKNINEVVNEI